MPAPASIAGAVDVVRGFADAYAQGRAAEGADLLAPDVHEREITPGGVVDQRGRAAVVDEATAFLRPFEAPEIVDHVVEPLGGLVRWSTRWRLRRGGDSWLIEWHAFASVEDGAITRLDVVCSGRVPDVLGGGCVDAGGPTA